MVDAATRATTQSIAQINRSLGEIVKVLTALNENILHIAKSLAPLQNVVDENQTALLSEAENLNRTPGCISGEEFLKRKE